MVQKTNSSKICKRLLKEGFKEYEDILNPKVKCFQKRLLQGENCETNGKPPSLSIKVFDISGNGMEFRNVSFDIFGEYGGHWLRSEIYNVQFCEFEEVYKKSSRILTAIWKAYTDNMK